MRDYTPHDIAKYLRDFMDQDLGVELRAAIPNLPEIDQRLILLYSQGRSPQEAAKELQQRRNPQRWFNNLIVSLARKANGRG